MAPRNTALSIKQKLLLISQAKKKEKSKQQLAKDFRCDISTVNRIIRNEQQLCSIAESNKNKEIKRIRKSRHPDVEKVLSIWFDQMRLGNAVISSQMVLNKAKEFAIKMNSDFEPNAGWLWRWQKRENIKFTKIHGESNENDREGAQSYLESHHFLELLNEYTPENIFNADESGLLYKVLPNGTLARTGDEVKGCKSQKQRLTLLFLCNSLGTYKKVFAIGKFQNPRCFKGNKNLPVPYFSNKNAWMTNSSWVNILQQIDAEMGKQNRKILLFVDNASCHKISNEFQNINLQFIPPNTTALIQPLDQGIIHSFKSHYRQIVVRKQLIALEKGLKLQDFIKSISILDALYYIKRAWWLVTDETIVNCFRKGGFSVEKDLNEPDDIQEYFGDIIIAPHNFNEYVNCDDNLQCYGTLTDEEIVEEMLFESAQNLPEDESINELNIANPCFKEALVALDVLRRFVRNRNFDVEEIENLETKILKTEVSNMCQTKIKDYFK